jgi:hypothetical protein
MNFLPLNLARTILGDDVLGPEEVAGAFGIQEDAVRMPFSKEELETARKAGEILVLRPGSKDHEPITIQSLIGRFPDAFDPRFLRTMGYLLKDEWGIELEPLTGTETCRAGWFLVPKEPLRASRNHTYGEQDAAVKAYAQEWGIPSASLQRRRAVEIVYDTLLYHAARGVRLLETTWDWSCTRTLDGGYLNVGGFGPDGLQIFSYSRAVRHGDLGVCPVRQAHC